MELSLILLAIITILAAASVSVLLFQRLGFGSVLGFIVASILVGPYTPGPIASRNVEGLQGIAELGVVLFLLTVGLEMRPYKLWAMRRLLFGLGSAQMIVTDGMIAAYGSFLVGMPWESAVILGLGLVMSSTVIIYLSQAGEFASVLLGAATVAGLLTDHGHVLAMLVVSITTILTPMMVQLGNWIGERAPSATG